MVIGITGGSGSGKSMISRALSDKGFLVIDADVIAREIVKVGEPALEEIKKAFGEEVILSDGSLNRKKLGNIVFSSKEKLNILNSITHKYITERIKDIINKNPGKDIIIDGAVLKESGISEILDTCVFVFSPKDVRKERIVKRDNLTAEEAEKRINSQKSDEDYRKECDFEVSNSGKESVLSIIEKVIEFIKKAKGSRM